MEIVDGKRPFRVFNPIGENSVRGNLILWRDPTAAFANEASSLSSKHFFGAKSELWLQEQTRALLEPP
jgi:hypothetical protein